MGSKFKIINSLDVKVWQDFVLEHPQGNIFHSPEMFRVFERVKGYRPWLWAATGDYDQLLALFVPVDVTLSNGFMRRLTTRSIAFGGVISSSDIQGKEALATLLSQYTQEAGHNSLFTEFRHLSDSQMFQPVFTKCGYTFENHLDYLIDLTRSEDDIWQAISKNGRKSIRRFHNKGVIIEEVSDRSLIPNYYNLLKQTYIRVGVPLADISLFEAVFEILVPKGMAKMLLARVNYDYVAASLEMPYKDMIYSWYSGYDVNWRSFNPNDGLVWHILEWGAKNKYKYFDFGGAGRINETYSVRDFKAKYGGRLVDFGRHTCIHAPVGLAFSRIGYKFYRQLIRLSPAKTALGTVTPSSESTTDR